LLLAGNVSSGVSYLARSRSSHTALYVLIEANVDEGVVSAPLSKYLPCQAACLTIAASSTTNLGVDMSKPRLRLIHCSNAIRRRAKHRRHDRSFRPLVIHGGARAKSTPGESSWENVLRLVDLGYLVCHLNYLAFLHASLTVLESRYCTDPEETS